MYYDPIEDSIDIKDEILKGEEAYKAYKQAYILRCKEEKKTRFTFVQRNKMYIILLCVVIAILGVFVLCNHSNNEDQTGIHKAESIASEQSDKNESEGTESLENENKSSDKKENSSDAKKVKYKVGMDVYFDGNVHYDSSYSYASSKKCKSGKATITKIKKNGAHPYNLKAKDKEGDVYGWVNEEDIRMLDEEKL